MRFVLLAIFVTVACGKGEEPPPPSSGSPSAMPESGPRQHTNPNTNPRPGGDDRAQALFNSMCATCHGAEGHGDGPAAANISPKPRDYTDAKWQASVTDDDLKRTIMLGGQKTGKSPMMPGNPQLKDQPEVLDGLVRIIRGFAKK
jgi:cytochrome c553